MNPTVQLSLAGVDVVPPPRPSRRGRKTREKGRRYARDRACPKCFHLFTRKGIARHVPACRKKKALTPPPARA